jgi:hypothetical protein
MASPQKIKEFMKESDSHKHYSQIIDLSLTYFITKAEKDGKTEFAAELKKGKENYIKDFNKAIEVTESVLGEMFTDDELDNLIILYSNPALSKARDIASEIVGKILEKYTQANK